MSNERTDIFFQTNKQNSSYLHLFLFITSQIWVGFQKKYFFCKKLSVKRNPIQSDDQNIHGVLTVWPEGLLPGFMSWVRATSGG